MKMKFISLYTSKVIDNKLWQAMFAMCLKWKDQKRRSRKTSHLVPFSSSKVIRLSVILFLVTSEISLYRICCFSNLDLHLDANVTADDTSLSNFNFTPAIIKSNRLFILIFPLSQAPIRRASYSPITSFSSSLLMLLRKSNVSRTLPNSPKVKKDKVTNIKAFMWKLFV